MINCHQENQGKRGSQKSHSESTSIKFQMKNIFQRARYMSKCRAYVLRQNLARVLIWHYGDLGLNHQIKSSPILYPQPAASQQAGQFAAHTIPFLTINWAKCGCQICAAYHTRAKIRLSQSGWSTRLMKVWSMFLTMQANMLIYTTWEIQLLTRRASANRHIL